MSIDKRIREFTSEHMRSIVREFNALDEEKAALQVAAARLAEIQVDQAALISEAQDILSKYNAQNGTSYTLSQVRVALTPKLNTI